MLLAGHYVIALPLAAVISGVTMEVAFGIMNREWFDPRRFDFKLLKELLAIAIPLLPNFLIYWVFNSCDKVMITNMIGIGAAGIYSVGSKLGHASQLIYTAFAGGWQYFAFSTMKDDDQIESTSNIFEYLGILSFVYELLQRYLSLKCGVRYNTKVGYGFVMNIVQKEPFGARKIRDIKVSDAQRWMIKLQKEGKGYSTLTSIRGVVKPAFQMAYNEEVVRRNPFDFKLTDVVVNDSQKRISLTEKQQKVWMNFIREDKSYAKYYDEFVVLLGTGMRVSEFCGLTLQDLDFQNRRIRVDHQLIRESGGKYYVEKTKTECGRRFIPMTEDVFQSLQNLLANRKRLKNEVIIDGYSGFLLLDKNDHPKVALHIENEMRWAMKKYRKLYPDAPLPHITPHVFRHTFCTNMANVGMDIKALQYVMGHSDASITLNVYTHASYDHAAEQMTRLVDFLGSSDRQERKMSG